MMAMTLARIGRSMKNFDMPIDSYVLKIQKTSVELAAGFETEASSSFLNFRVVVQFRQDLHGVYLSA